MKTYQITPDGSVELPTISILEKQIEQIRSQFTPTGLRRIAQTRDGFRFHATTDVFFKLVLTSPVDYHDSLIPLLGEINVGASRNEEARINLEATLVNICVEMIEKFCEYTDAKEHKEQSSFIGSGESFFFN
jgi:hypothetical protein